MTGNAGIIKKRVHAVRRAPDGSSFQKCDQCGTSVAISLLDMHVCGGNTKKHRNNSESLAFQDQPRSAFCFFMESYMKNCKAEGWVEIGRAAFEFWANMSPKERHPFVKQAEHVNSAYLNKLLEEAGAISQTSQLALEMFTFCLNVPFQEEDEADSAAVGKIDLTRCREDGDPLGYGGCFHWMNHMLFESFASSDCSDPSPSRATSPH